MPDQWPTVGAITIWYGVGTPARARFIDRLRALRYPCLSHVFVIHKQSSEEVADLQRAVPQATVIQPGANLGAAAGWNLAIAHLLAQHVEYVGIWNVDVSPDAEWLNRMVEVMAADPAIGACQPLLLYSDAPDTVQMFGGSLNTRTAVARHDFNGATDLDSLPPLHECEYLDGGTMLVRADVVRAVGVFDEQLFMYLEDCDLSVRIRSAGFRLVAVRDARAWHHHRAELGRLPTVTEAFYATRNRFYFARKYGGRRAKLEHAVRWSIALPRLIVYFARRGRLDLTRASLHGATCGVLGKMGKRGWVD